MQNLHHNCHAPPNGAFAGGIRLRGYTKPRENKIQKACAHARPKKIKTNDIEDNVKEIIKKHNMHTYTMEAYFEHSPPKIFKEITSINNDKYNIIYTVLLSNLCEAEIETLEWIQIEYMDGSIDEITNIDEIKSTFLELYNGGYSNKANIFIPSLY